MNVAWFYFSFFESLFSFEVSKLIFASGKFGFNLFRFVLEVKFNLQKLGDYKLLLFLCSFILILFSVIKKAEIVLTQLLLFLCFCLISWIIGVVSSIDLL